MHTQDDLENEFLNIADYFAATNNDDDIWSNTSQGMDSRQDGNDDDDLLEQLHVSGSGDANATRGSSVSPRRTQTIKKEMTPEHSQDGDDECEHCGCGDDEDEDSGADSKLEIKTDDHRDAEAVGTSGPGSMDLLDDGTWLDFDPQEDTGAALTSPTLMQRFALEHKNDTIDERMDDGILCEEDADGLLLGDDMDDLPSFTDADVAALVASNTCSNTGMLTVSTSSSSNSSGVHDAMPRSVLSPAAPRVAPLSSPSTFGGHGSNSVFVSDQDIPDMVNLFSSMYSPTEASRLQQQQHQHQHQHQHVSHNSSHHLHQHQNHQPPLSIMVPTQQMLNAMYPFANTALSPTPQPSSHTNTSLHHSTSAPPAPLQANQFEFFTPPGVTNNRVLDANTVFLSPHLLSPYTKSTSVFHTGAPRSTMPPPHQLHTATAAAVALANSNTMRKMQKNTYGVPIAPMQRSILTDASLPLKPKLVTATATSATTIAATFGSSTKVAKISITPDISDFKLVQIFHNFCDPVTKVVTLPRFHQLLQCHAVKDDHATTAQAAQAAIAKANSSTTNSTTKAGTTSASSTASSSSEPTAETQALFKILDKKNCGFLDLECFMNSFQICNRCTEAKRRVHSAMCAAQGQSFVSTALERQLMEDVAPVIVRVVPTSFEGAKVKSCEHYQWTWCEGFDKTGNEKCKGTNRHDKCPKYLANCTLWKHKLPPKNRKSKIFENIESPSKKFKHFA